jgi:hypothetical protein
VVCVVLLAWLFSLKILLPIFGVTQHRTFKCDRQQGVLVAIAVGCRCIPFVYLS